MEHSEANRANWPAFNTFGLFAGTALAGLGVVAGLFASSLKHLRRIPGVCVLFGPCGVVCGPCGTTCAQRGFVVGGGKGRG